MELAAIVLALSIIIASLIKKSYHVKPRKLFCSFTLTGATERGEESLQLTTSLFEDEDELVWKKKMDKLFEIRERRLKHQNDRILQANDRLKEILKKESELQGREIRSLADVKDPEHIKALLLLTNGEDS